MTNDHRFRNLETSVSEDISCKCRPLRCNQRNIQTMSIWRQEEVGLIAPQQSPKQQSKADEDKQVAWLPCLLKDLLQDMSDNLNWKGIFRYVEAFLFNKWGIQARSQTPRFLLQSRWRKSDVHALSTRLVFHNMMKGAHWYTQKNRFLKLLFCSAVARKEPNITFSF